MLHLSRPLLLCLPLLLAACVGTAPLPSASPAPQPVSAPIPDDPESMARAFISVASRIEPVAEDLCRRSAGPVNCDLVIGVDSRPGLPPNAFQTVDERGRPYIVFTIPLIALARNTDELAFVMGHEAAHHIAGHIPKRQDQAMAGAILAGVIAAASGMSEQDIRAAQTIGADVGALRFSKEFELEADALGTEIAWAAGYDPARGAAFFDRLPDPGDQFLGSHPPNGQRKAVIAQTLRRLTGQ